MEETDQKTDESEQPEQAQTNQIESTEQLQQDTENAAPKLSKKDEKLKNATAPSSAGMVVSGHSHRKRNIIIAAITLVTLIGGSAAAYYATRPSVQPNTVKQPVATQTPKPEPTVEVTGYTLLDEPKKVDSLHFFSDLKYFGEDCNGIPSAKNCPPLFGEADISYYEVGKTPDNKALLTVKSANKFSENSFWYLAQEVDDNKYEILAVPSSMNLYGGDLLATYKQFRKNLADNVTLNTTDEIPELQFPLTIEVGGVSFKKPQYSEGGIKDRYGYFVDDLKYIRNSFGATVSANALTKLGTDKNATIYRVLAEDKTNYKIYEIHGLVKPSFVVSYESADPLADYINKPKITWTKGEKIKSGYFSGIFGCGYAYGYVSLKNISDSDLTKVGTDVNGRALYQVSTSTPIFKEIYKTDYNKGVGVYDNKALKNLTETEFQNQHALIVTKTTDGEYVLHLRDDMFQYGGCGKPVVYLYPRNATDVSVQVGANVTVSEPQYHRDGWQKVHAEPNGQLTYRGQNYPYLFWEGTGFGPYPNITNQGVVVARSQAAPTIKSQLKQQGLNAKETADFLEFWQPRLPDTRFVRLTWLNTQQMNQLAPLAISPKPDTTIRVFLDFQGLDAPAKLQPQQFSAPARNGFTVVEWGGLLNGELR